MTADVVPSIEFWRLALGAGIAVVVLSTVFGSLLGRAMRGLADRQSDAVDELDEHRRDRDEALRRNRNGAA